MISMQQLEELENRIVKALQLINDLRSENAKYENENESLRSEVEEARLSLEEKEQEIQRIKKELDDATRELKDIKDREEVLEKKVIGLLGKLEILQSGSIPQGKIEKTIIVEKTETKKSVIDTSSSKTGFIADVPSKNEKQDIATSSGFISKEEKKRVTESDDFDVQVDDVSIETVDTAETFDDDDDDIIIVDDDTDLENDDIVLEKHMDADDSEDEIILLDDDDDEIIIDDVDDETIIIDEPEASRNKPVKEVKKEQKKPFIDEDDEFLIIEDEDKK